VRSSAFVLRIHDRKVIKISSISKFYNACEIYITCYSSNKLFTRAKCIYHVYVNAQNSRSVQFMWERTCRCISDYPRAERCVWHAQCVAQAPHAYTCRTDRDLCHWLRSVHRRVYRRSVPRVRIKRVSLVWLDISRSIVRRTKIGDLSRPLIIVTFSIVNTFSSLFSLSTKATKFNISKNIVIVRLLKFYINYFYINYKNW